MKRIFRILILAGLLAGCEKSERCSPDTFTLALDGEQVNLAKEIADKWIASRTPESLSWNWEPGVLMYSFTKLYEYTGDAKYFDYYRAWIDYYIERGYYMMMSDQVIPSATAADLYRRTCEEKYRLVIDDTFVYLSEEAPRTPEGGISHLGTIAPAAPQLWIDSLFMFGMPLLNSYRAVGDRKYIDLLAEQMIIFAEILQDSEAGLFRHAWINQQKVPEEPVFWARGNSWVLVSLAEFLGLLPDNYENSERLKNIYISLLNAVEKYQDSASGLWFTVLNRPGETYLETSGSALFTYGILKGINEGIIALNEHITVAEKGISGIKSKIDTSSGQPVITGISKGTQPGGFDNYAGVELGDDIPYGIGGVILSLIEYQRFLNE
jgi:unsaturated rhamnogalacturonyl hydrolase